MGRIGRRFKTKHKSNSVLVDECTLALGRRNINSPFPKTNGTSRVVQRRDPTGNKPNFKYRVPVAGNLAVKKKSETRSN